MSTTAIIEAEKAALRASAKARRKVLLDAEGPDVARRIAAHGIDFLKPRAEWVVSGYVSMPDEIGTGPLMGWLHAEGYRLAMPVMQGKKKPLLFRAFAPGDDMDTAVWGIAEPKADKEVLTPDVVVVPLLAFDRQGWRVGYGGGFYDRTLSHLRAHGRVVTVGWALDDLEVDAVPHLDYDEPLDWVLTPSGPRRLAR